jgi:hypothetical protein
LVELFVCQDRLEAHSLILGDSTSFFYFIHSRASQVAIYESFVRISEADARYLQTTEITRLQIGEDPEDVRIIVSTLSEAENLLPLLLEYQHKGLQVSVGRTAESHTPPYWC